MALSTSAFLAAAVLVAGGLGTFAFLNHAGTDDCPGSVTSGAFASSGTSCASSRPACPEGDTEPYRPEEAQGLLRVELENVQRATGLYVCITDAAGTKRFEHSAALPAEETTAIDVAVPFGLHHAYVRVGSGNGHAAVQSDVRLADDTCAEDAIAFPVRVESKTGSDIHVSGNANRCIDPDRAGTAAPMGALPASPPPPPRLVERLAMAGLVFSVTMAGLAGLRLIVRSDAPRWVWLGLFSRIMRPRALDHGLRARVHRAIEENPGIHGEALRRHLGVAAGQVAHHLRVLVRTGLVTRIRIGGRAHHFTTGTRSPSEMRRIALLCSEPARRLYEALQRGGPADVSTLAATTGLSPSQTSRHAQRLAAAQLVGRERQGRHVVLRALG